jgi:hypothetical protein
MITLSDNTFLNRVWVSWNIQNNYNNVYTNQYERVSRRGFNAQMFETWLFQQGAIVQRSNKKCYLQFVDEEEALVFRLKYT